MNTPVIMPYVACLTQMIRVVWVLCHTSAGYALVLEVLCSSEQSGIQCTSRGVCGIAACDDNHLTQLMIVTRL